LFQLGQAFEVAKSIHTGKLQLITIAAVAEATLITYGFEERSVTMLAVGGLILLFLAYQLGNSDRALELILETAYSLEEELGLKGERSVARVVDPAISAPKSTIKANIEKTLQSSTSLLVIVFGIGQIIAAFVVLGPSWQ